MRLRFFLPLFLLSAIGLSVIACGDDNDSDTPDDQPEATEVMEEDGSDTATPEGDSEDESFSDDGAAESTGTITIGEMVFEFNVEFCEGSIDQVARAAGPGQTPDGQPFWVEVRWGLGGPVSTQLGVGIEEPSAQEGEPHWVGEVMMDEAVSFDDGLRINYSAPFEDVSTQEESPIDGTVDVSCELS